MPVRAIGREITLAAGFPHHHHRWSVYGSQADHEKHTWTRVELPAGYESGSIS